MARSLETQVLKRIEAIMFILIVAKKYDQTDKDKHQRQVSPAKCFKIVIHHPEHPELLRSFAYSMAALKCPLDMQ